MKRFHIDMVCDEGHVAAELMHLANYMEEAEKCDEYYFDNATAIVEEYPEED